MSVHTATQQNAQIASIAHQQNEILNFHYLQVNDSPFSSIVEKALGTADFNKLLDQQNRRCQALLSLDEQLIGLIVYKNRLKDNDTLKDCFVLKKFLILRADENPEGFYANILLNRVIQLANRSNAKMITLKISESSRLANFFNEKEFKVQKTWHSRKESDSKIQLICLSLLPQKDLSFTSPKMKPPRVTAKEETPSSRECSLKRSFSTSDISRTLIPSKRQKRDEPGRDEPGLKESLKEGQQAAQRNSNRRDIDEAPLRRRVSEPSLKASAPKTHKLPMKGTQYFDYIMSGKKQFEGRVCGPACQNMQVGDMLSLFDGRAKWGIICEIVSKDVYRSFDAMLRSKGVLNMLPQLEAIAKQTSPEELINAGVKIYKSFPGSNRVTQSGAIAIGVKFIKKIFS